MKFRLIKTSFYLFVLLAVSASIPVFANVNSTIKIINHGSDANKLVIAVLGDGYSSSPEDQQKYQDDVQRLIVDGVFGHDYFREKQTAFNVYRVNLVSRDSGVSTPEAAKNTALKIVYNGDWNRCWLNETPDISDHRIRQALGGIVKYDYVLIVANNNEYGGCRRGNRLYITSGVNWDLVSHEYGHAVGNLYDEYFDDNPALVHPAHLMVNERNCSSRLDRNSVVWKDILGDDITLPTVEGNGIDLFTTVGMFEGCLYKRRGIYRPSFHCRMRTNQPEFCSICRSLLTRAINPYLSEPAPGQIGTRQKYLNVEVKIGQNGEVEVLGYSEAEADIDVDETKIVSNYLYQITRDNNIINVAFLPEDPFVVRGFPDPNNPRGEFIGQSENSIVTVKIPGAQLEDIKNNRLKLNFYRLTEKPRVQSEQSLENINTEKFLNLLKTKSIEREIQITPRDFKIANIQKTMSTAP